MKFRRRTLWFRQVFGEWHGVTPTEHHRWVLVVRTPIGVWGEWW